MFNNINSSIKTIKANFQHHLSTRPRELRHPSSNFHNTITTMLSRSFLALCLAPMISATKLDIYVMYSGGGGMDLGGGSTWSQGEVRFRIDDGEWRPIKNAKSDFLCAHYCSNDWTSEYTLGDLGGREFYMCQIGGNCVPGNDFSCKIWYNGEEKTFDATQDSSFIGIATSTTSWCGGTFEDA